MTNTDNKTEIKLSTGLLPIIDVGMYGGFLESDYMLESSLSELSPQANEQYWDLYDHKLYVNEIFKLAGDFIQSDIKDYLIELGAIDIIPVKINSPRFYNFENDELYYDLIVSDNFIDNIVNKINSLDTSEGDKLNKFLFDSYKSYDGFHSFMPQCIDDLIEALNNDTVRGVTAYLAYTIGNDQLKEWQEQFNYYAMEHISYYTEFIPYDIDKVKYAVLLKELDELSGN